MSNGFPFILRMPGQTKCLRSVEGDRISDLFLGRRVCSYESGLFSIFGLGLLWSWLFGWGWSQRKIKHLEKTIILAVFPLALVGFEVAIWMQSKRALCKRVSRDEVGDPREMHVHPNASIVIHHKHHRVSAQQLLIKHLRCKFSHTRERNFKKTILTLRRRTAFRSGGGL